MGILSEAAPVRVEIKQELFTTDNFPTQRMDGWTTLCWAKHGHKLCLDCFSHHSLTTAATTAAAQAERVVSNVYMLPIVQCLGFSES